MDVVNFDEILRKKANILTVDPKIINDDKTVADIKNFFSCKQNVGTINQLANILIIEDYKNNTIPSFITGLNVIFTGTLNSISRNEAKAKAEKF